MNDQLTIIPKDFNAPYEHFREEMTEEERNE